MAQAESAQLELDFHAPAGDGYALWQWDHRQALATIAEKWNLPLNRKVRLTLLNIDCEFTGTLLLAERPLTLDSSKPLCVRLGNMKFSSNEIERCAVLEKQGAEGNRRP